MPAVYPIVTHTSVSAAHARSRVLKLYRDWLKACPSIVYTYSLDIPASTVRSRVRYEFLKNKTESNPALIDRMIFQGRLEYEETMNQWKQKNHVMNYFDNPPEEALRAQKKGFLEKFYSNPDL